MHQCLDSHKVTIVSYSVLDVSDIKRDRVSNLIVTILTKSVLDILFCLSAMPTEEKPQEGHVLVVDSS